MQVSTRWSLPLTEVCKLLTSVSTQPAEHELCETCTIGHQLLFAGQPGECSSIRALDQDVCETLGTQLTYTFQRQGLDNHARLLTGTHLWRRRFNILVPFPFHPCFPVRREVPLQNGSTA